jgi:cyclopropane fatty-acyl-phospholipid synthase-like methyltransferase
VPIVWSEVTKYHGNNVLDIGNVLSHYYSIEHEVVDKYEQADGVINEDVINFSSVKGYDLIVSISTLEHVGWDETPRDPVKLIIAIDHLKSLLKPGGRMIVTLPLGYNKDMDRALYDGKIVFDEQYYLKRIASNRWVEANWKDMKNILYGSPFQCANGLIIGIDHKK